MNPNEWELAKLRQQDLIREAEAHNQAQQTRRSKPSLFSTMMANVGGKMVTIGETLQERYSDPCDKVCHAEA